MRRKIIGKFKDWFYSSVLQRQLKQFHREQEVHPPKRVIYTCITADYDCLVVNMFRDSSYKYVCFTDNREYLRRGRVGVWNIEPLRFDRLDNTRNNRYHKMHPHELFPQYEESLFIDANIQIKSSKLFDAVSSLRESEVFLAIPPHRRRGCAYDELEECLAAGKDDETTLRRHQAFLEAEGFPHGLGLSENNVIYRKHHHPQCIKIMEGWWDMVERFSRRDQLSLFYVLWKNGEQMTYLLESPIKGDKDNFRLFHHNR